MGRVLIRNVTIVVPSKSQQTHDHPSHQAMVYTVASRLTEEFGGATAIPGRGFWANSRGDIVKEDVTEVSTFIDNDGVPWSEIEGKIMGILWYVFDVMKQDSVMYKLNDTVYFYTGSDLEVQ